MRLLAIVIVLLVPAVSVVPISSSADADTEAAVFAAVPALPEGSRVEGLEGVTTSALELAAALGAVRVPADDGGPGEPCPASRLAVSWEQPGVEYFGGAYVHPVGPEPTANTTEVNGVVLCEDAPGYFMGFTATWTDLGWAVFDIPAPDHHDGTGPLADALLPSDLLELSPFELTSLLSIDVDLPSRWTGRWGPDIEGFAPYEPQQLCDPWPKPGMQALTGLVLNAYPDTASWGIARDCAIGGRSEHKEGRAWDWRVDVFTSADAEAADAVISWLLATDEHGNVHAMARRLGVMYIIWNRMIWSSSRPADGWRPYFGASPHTDHVHLSLSRDGALGRTSFWKGVALDTFSVGTNPFAGIASALPARLSQPPVTVVEAERRRAEVEQRRAERRAAEEAEEAEEAEDAQDDAAEDAGGTSDGTSGGATGGDSGSPAPAPVPGPVEDALPLPLPSPPTGPPPAPSLPPSPDAGEALDPILDEAADLVEDLGGALEGAVPRLP